jgi:hypothetical protein
MLAAYVFVQSFGEVPMFSRTPHARRDRRRRWVVAQSAKPEMGLCRRSQGGGEEGGHDVNREGAMRVASGFWRLLSCGGVRKLCICTGTMSRGAHRDAQPPSQQPRPTPAASQTWADAARSRAGLPTGACERPASQLLNGHGGRRFVERGLARRLPTLKPTA